MLFRTFIKVQVFSHCVQNYGQVCLYSWTCDYRSFTAWHEIGSHVNHMHKKHCLEFIKWRNHGLSVQIGCTGIFLLYFTLNLQMLLNWPLLIVVVDDALESSSFLSPAKVRSFRWQSFYIHTWAWGMFFILVKFTSEYYKYINIFQWIQSSLF